MKICKVVNGRVERLYQEYMTFLEDLRIKTKDERIELYDCMSRKLFPHSKKTFDLEDQLNEHRKDYQRKFKEYFLIVCDWTISGSHLGESCFNYFKKGVVKKSKKDKCYSEKYAHKVILALGLMGYFESVKCNYSNSRIGGHGYIYNVDLFKWAELGKSAPRGNVSMSLEVDIDWSGYEDWYGERQYETIASMSVDPKDYEQAKTYLEKCDDFYTSTTLKADEKKHLTDKWFAAKSLTAIAEHDDYFMLRHSDDSEKNSDEQMIHNAGRYYTSLTNMQGDVRRECLFIDGEHIVEVDVSAAQPSMLGLLLRKKHPDVKSAWLRHCEIGDFYEWIGLKVLGRRITKQERKAIKILIMRMLYTAQKPTEKQCKTPFYKYLEIYLKEKDPSKKENMEKGGLFKSFDFEVLSYLKAKEPKLYGLICEYRTNLREVKRKRPTATGKTTKRRNDLSISMAEREVEYIKACLKKIAPEVKYFYTIHDCIGCKASDAEKVKAAMLEVAMEMFNAKLNIKLESGSGETVLDGFKFIAEEVVMKKKGWNQKKNAA